MPKTQYFIGWDVGGWHCSEKGNEGKSCDAIVILDADLNFIGTAWRGNLRETINQAQTTSDFLECLFHLCDCRFTNEAAHVVLAIDTPLGFSEAFQRLVCQGEYQKSIEESAIQNPYLYRATEHFLDENKIKRPLSAIQDMIGSQATKGIHVLAKFAPKIAGCGIWTDGNLLTIIEAYPAACEKSSKIHALKKQYGPHLNHGDKKDAVICALIGYLFAIRPNTLIQPAGAIPETEGWIWVPQDVLS